MLDFYLKDKLKEYDIGEYSYGSPNVIDWHDGTKLKVGKFCSFATGVTILLSGEHHHEYMSNYPFICNPDFNNKVEEMTTKEIAKYIKSKGDVVIGNDVWIGWNTLILSGVTIGNGAVIGAGSVVAKDVLPYSIVGGNPARLIKMRFLNEKIQEIENSKWWDWPLEKIQKSIYILNAKP